MPGMYMGRTRLKKACRVKTGDGLKVWDQDWRVHGVDTDELGNVKIQVHGDEISTRQRHITVVRLPEQQLETF
jgi:hypothetical protein